MSAQRLKQSVSVWMDRIRRKPRTPQGLQPNRAEICMSALKLRPAKEEARNGTGLKIGHYKATNREPTGFEGGHARCKETETQDGEVDPPPQRPLRCSLDKWDTLIPKRVSYREPA
jgi:hypothetical protein